MSDFPGINFAYQTRVAADSYRVAHFLLRHHEINE